MFARFFKLMLNQGINLAPSKYEAWFLTIAHTDDDIAYTLKAVEHAFKKPNIINRISIIMHFFIHPQDVHLS
ncbi:hypothetical protein RCO48_05330 [Peribacillus frigoritolerans]|nr:hypothetical protein [Peribacillus frigoritolerans]